MHAGMLRMYETKLKEAHPGAKGLSYDFQSLCQYVDDLVGGAHATGAGAGGAHRTAPRLAGRPGAHTLPASLLLLAEGGHGAQVSGGLWCGGAPAPRAMRTPRAARGSCHAVAACPPALLCSWDASIQGYKRYDRTWVKSALHDQLSNAALAASGKKGSQ